MEEEFYSIIILVSGEEVFALVSVDENDDNPVLLLQNPVIMSTIHTPGGSMIKVRPWMDMTDETMFIVRLDKVITMIESKDKKLIDVYNNYNDDTDEDGIINMYDEDDDGDGILTKDELDGDDPDNLPDDSNNDGIPDYLDKNN